MAEIPRPPVLHRVARRWALSGLRGGVLFWRLVDRLDRWPSGGLVRVWPGLVIPVVPHDYVAAGFYRGTYERAEFEVVRRLLRGASAPVLVDVGANFGAYTSLFSSLAGPQGRVLAFEPAPATYAMLDELVRSAPLRNVRPYPMAVGRERGRAGLTDLGEPGNSGLASLRPGGGPGEDLVEVDVVSLSDIDELVGSEIDMVKVDVEGFEEEVLAGAVDLFVARRVRLALVEVSPQFGNTRFLSEFFAGPAAGYACFSVGETGNVRRRPALNPVTPPDVAAATEQFNLLAVRQDLVTGLPWPGR